MYKVKLTYFKSTGKYYSDAVYYSEKEHLHEIWTEIKHFNDNGMLPGLVDGAKMPLISVNVKKHPNRHPHLIVSMENES